MAVPCRHPRPVLRSRKEKRRYERQHDTCQRPGPRENRHAHATIRWKAPLASLDFPLPDRASSHATMSRAWGNDMAPEGTASGTMWLYVGTYTHGKMPSEGIYLLELDLASGRLTTKGAVARLPNPSFLAIHPSRKFLYAVNELEQVQRPERGRRQRLPLTRPAGCSRC